MYLIAVVPLVWGEHWSPFTKWSHRGSTAEHIYITSIHCRQWMTWTWRTEVRFFFQCHNSQQPQVSSLTSVEHQASGFLKMLLNANMNIGGAAFILCLYYTICTVLYVKGCCAMWPPKKTLCMVKVALLIIIIITIIAKIEVTLVYNVGIHIHNRKTYCA